MNRASKDLLSAFCDARVDFLVVGAHALAAHGHLRATRVLDVWVRPGRENAAKGPRVPVLSRHHLIANKRTAGRMQDLADVEILERLERQPGDLASPEKQD